MDKAYSMNDDGYRKIEQYEILAELYELGQLAEGTAYYEIDTEPVSLVDYLDAEVMLDSARDHAYDELGDCVEDEFKMGQEAMGELNTGIRAWAENHLSSFQFWRCVGASRQLHVTAEDVAACTSNHKID